jgi:uncharacterized protein (TIGR00369 family)
MTFQPVMSAAEVTAFWDRHFPQVRGEELFEIVSIAPGEAVLRLAPGERHLRPGGTVSGPTLFAIADVAAYAALLAHVGPEPLMLTVSFTINFMRRAPFAPLLAECRILKLGKRLAVVEIGVRPEADGELVAHATATYSIPDRTLP